MVLTTNASRSVILKTLSKPVLSAVEASKGQDLKPRQLFTAKLLLIMKFTAIILLSACLAAGAKGTAQTISIDVKDAPLEKVFKTIEQQSGYTFFFNYHWLKKARAVTVTTKNVSLEEALNSCFKNQPFSYEIVNKTIVVKEKEPVLSAIEGSGPTHDSRLTIDVSGRVTDPSGSPLAGASITVKGKAHLGTKTDAAGVFSIKGLEATDVITISYAEHIPQSFTVGSTTNYGVKLERASEDLKEVIINKGYYTEKQKYSVGNVGRVTAKDIEKQLVSNPLLALQGRVPGLFVEQANGIPGTGVQVRIQGQNSLSSGSNPLYVIDGVPYITDLPTSVSNIQGNSGNAINGVVGSSNPLAFINPLDIESIEVLKDADATAIYGSRGAGGVILITTKKGKSGQSKIEMSFQQGFGKVSRFLSLLNTEQYLAMRTEAKANDNAPINPGDYDINGVWDKSRYTNWQKELLGGTSLYSDAQLSFSGGAANTTYLIGTGYHRESSVFPGKNYNQKSSVHFNIRSKSNNQRFQIQLDGKYLLDNIKLPGTDLTANAVNLAPNAPSLYNDDGSLNWAPTSTGISTWKNPLTYLNEKFQSKISNLIANININYKLLPGLDISSSFGYVSFQKDESIIIPLSTKAPELRASSVRSSIFGDANITSWIVEPQVNYTKVLKQSTLSILLGSTFHQSQLSHQQIQGYGFNSDQVMNDIKSAPTLVVNSTNASTYRYNAVFGRVNYNLQNKYIVNLTARRDGSSRFGSENLFHNFSSVGVGWIFSNENSIRKHFPFLSNGKLRASYGTTGNDQIGDYRFMNLYETSTRQVPYQGVTGLTIRGLSNPYLQWEETRKLQLGLDLGLWAERIVINSTFFLNRSSNQLQSSSLPTITGADRIDINFPATIQNSGWEFSFHSTNLKKNSFAWNTQGNITLPKNKLVSYRDFEKSTLVNSLVIGKPITILKRFDFAGVDPATGVYQFFKFDGSLSSNPNPTTDQMILVDLAPKFYGGFQNSFTYKGLSLDFLFQFVKQTAINYRLGNQPGRFSSDLTFGATRGNQPTTVLDRWQKPGDISNIQRFSTTYPVTLLLSSVRASGSDAIYEDASYIRLKNISLSWQLPLTWVRNISLQNARVFAQGQNILTITKYIGLDPESRSITSLPPLRVITFGLQVSF